VAEGPLETRSVEGLEVGSGNVWVIVL
jgi:hypothetical protein